MTIRLSRLWLFGFAALIAGCDVLAPVPAPADQLVGRTFLATSVQVNGADRPLVAGTQIRLSFEAGQLGASAGCNSMGGAWRLDGDTLVVDAMAMTEMGCDPDRSAQDTWLASLLGSRPAVTVTADGLALRAGQTVVTFVDRRIAEPDRPLVGPAWIVNGLVAGEAVASIPDGVVASLAFGADGQVEIRTGCNAGGATVLLDGARLQFRDIVTDDAVCPGPAGEVESAVLAVLGSPAVTFRIEATSLTLDGGGRGLILVAG